MIVHPPWRTLAEEILKAKDPELYRELKGDGLEDHLDQKAEHARGSYEHLVNLMLIDHPGEWTWVLQAAQEMIVRDILDPTT